MKTKILMLVIWGLMSSACSDWLDVTPKDSVVEDNLFEESTGFHNALNGVYEAMASTELYGRELTYGMIDAMGQVYALSGESYRCIKSYHYYYQATKFQYTANKNIKDAFEGIWQTAYNTIANCNNIIGNVDRLTTADFRLGEAERNLIKGEAMAVRALLHFDLLRIFAPAPVVADAKLYIPYVKTFPYYGGQVPLSVAETMENIEQDLLEAKKMIMAYDTLNLSHRALLSNYYRFEPANVSSLSNDGSEVQMLAFYQYRGYRMNALAVTAMLARVYSWWGGDKIKLAAENAEEVVNFLSHPGDNRLALEYTKNKLQYDRKFRYDLIFALSYALLQEEYAEYALENGNACLTLSKYNQIWEYDLADGGDNRAKLIKDDWGYFPLKNIRPEGSDKVVTITEDMVPMIRLSEMHFVLAEYYAAIENFPKAAEAITKVRVGRNCKGEVDLGIIDKDTFKQRLLGEVRREFFSEGQTFFYYKKMNEPLVTDMNTDLFVVSKPDSENIN